MTALNLASHSLMDTLKDDIDMHALWLQSGGRQGRRANFSGMNLQGIDLRDCYLPEANFRTANLRGANLSGADLQGADFSQSVVENANFMNAKLEGSNFARCAGTGIYFNRASMTGANLTGAIMDASDFSDTNLSGAKCREALFARSNFTRANLDCAILRYVNAVEAIFDEANLAQADCRDAEFKYAKFKEANLAGANMRKANLDHVSFSYANFSKAIDLDPSYHVRSIEAEKQEVKQELRNLVAMREEIGHFEEHVNEQKRQIVLKRKVLDGLNELESEVGESFQSYMKIFRAISVFWFVVVALFATILLYRISKIGIKNLNYLELGVVAGIMLIVLGAHVFSAITSLNLSKKFARYVRVRREKLSLLESDQPIEVQTGEPPVVIDMGHRKSREVPANDTPQVMYL